MKYLHIAVALAICVTASLASAQMEPAIDDATMARVRLANLVFGSGATDLYLDGQIIVLGDSRRELTGVPVGAFTGFSYVEPGTHSVAIVPMGQGLDEAMIALEVTLEPGHRYSVLAMGQKDDTEVTPLVIDETAALAEARTSPEQYVMIFVNNQKGAETIDFIEDGVGLTDIRYGDFVAGALKAGHVDKLVVTVNGEVVPDNPGNFDELPGVDIINAVNGSFRGVVGQYESPFMSDLNALELLEQITAFDFAWMSFDTFLTMVERAGLGELLSTGTHLIFAPTDAAFAALPPEQLSALLADPAALAKLLRYHVVDGYYPPGALSDAIGVGAITVTNLEGAELAVHGPFVNGVNKGDLVGLVVADGTRIEAIATVLLPPSP